MPLWEELLARIRPVFARHRLAASRPRSLAIWGNRVGFSIPGRKPAKIRRAIGTCRSRLCSSWKGGFFSSGTRAVHDASWSRSMTIEPGPLPFRVAVVQAAPVVFNLEKTLEKVHRLAREAAAQGAKLAVFPEAFVSAYPRGLGFGAVGGSRSESGRDDFRRYWESSVDVPGPAVDSLGRAAGENEILLVVGVVERELGTLYCTVLFFAPNGSYMGKHRK